jgi:predicted nucleic acid binding AN1-type Zn finger protein
MARCVNCKKKGIPITCKYCTNGYCSSCIQLEIHKCSGIETKNNEEKTNLEKKLIRVEASRIVKI